MAECFQCGAVFCLACKTHWAFCECPGDYDQSIQLMAAGQCPAMAQQDGETVGIYIKLPKNADEYGQLLTVLGQMAQRVERHGEN